MIAGRANTLVLTCYALSSGYQAHLEQTLAETPVYLQLSDLRRLGIAGLIKHFLRSGFRRVILPYEVPEGECTLSLLKLIGAAHRLPRLEVSDPECKLHRVRLRELIAAGFGSLGATFSGQVARSASSRAARLALRTPRRHDPFRSGKQRVLYLKNSLWFGLRAGGSVGHVAGVINGLAELGHKVCFVSPESPKLLSKSVEFHTVPIFRHYAIPAEANLFRMRKRALNSALAAAQAFKPTMVYQRLSLGDWTGVEVAHALGIPLVVEYNGSELWVSRNWGGSKIRYEAEMEGAEGALLGHADLVFTISEALNEQLLARGLEPSRVAWYPNCVDCTVFNPSSIAASDRSSARSRLNAEVDEFVIMFIGTFGLWHGAEIFALAAARLASNGDWMRNNRVRFAFVGDGKTRSRCVDIIQSSRAALISTFTGLVPQNEAPAYLAAADAYVASHVPNTDGSKFFGSPTKLFEYMAMGRPIVASALDQISDILSDGRTAVLVPPGDVEALADGLRRVVEDRALGDRLGASARTEALAKYTWHRHAQEILAALERTAKEVR